MESYVIKFPSERRRADLSVFLASYANDYGTTDDHGEHSDAVANAVPLDLDALRLVLDAADFAHEVYVSNGDPDGNADAISDAIAKIESLIR